MKSAIRYVAEAKHVREVSLVGSADHAFWKERLRAEELFPSERDGRARIMIVGANMRFMGVRFTEVSFSILLSSDGCRAAGEWLSLVEAGKDGAARTKFFFEGFRGPKSAR